MWHFAKNGQTVGPMERLELVERAHRGEFGPDDLVWHADFGQEWRPARTIEGLFVMAGEAPPAAAGTGGLTPNGELTRRAREALKGHWGIAIGFTILVQMLMFAIVMLAGLLDLVVPLASTVVQILVVAPVSVGAMMFYLALVRRQDAQLGLMFAGFRSWWPAVGANLLMVVLIIGWILLVMLPFGILGAVLGITNNLKPDQPLTIVFAVLAGFTYVMAVIVLSLRYAMTFYAIADDPTCGPATAIRRSVQLMRGHKAKLFFLGFRFVGWALLCMLTCGLGFLWLMPYAAVSTAAFYDDVKRPED